MAYRYQEFIDELRRGATNGVFIDDTGSPGVSIPNSRLHPQRKSWVAVVVPHWHMSEVVNQFYNVIPFLQETFGVAEFHFGDIYAGRGNFESISLQQRLGIFRFMTSIFQSYSFPILVQTFDPITHRNAISRADFPEKFGPFILSKLEDFGLLFLLMRVKQFIGMNSLINAKRSRVFVDEGYKKNGAAIRIERWNDWISDGLICFAQSDNVMPIQLADFAAFSLNRSQIIQSKEKKSELDIEMLEILSAISWNYQNILKVSKNILDMKDLISKN